MRRWARWKTSLELMLLVAVFSALAAGCRDSKAKEPTARKPVPVTVSRAERREVELRLSAFGHVEAEATVAVRTRVGGELVRVHFREGDEVRAGDLLFTIDPRPLAADLRQAEAVLARDAALLENARAEARRYEQLFGEKLVSQREYDQFLTSRASLEATLEADRAAVEQARLQLSYAEIRAPIAGRTGALQVHQGNLVKANDEVPLVIIHQIRPVAVSFAVPELRLAEVRRHLQTGDLVVEAAPAGDSGPPERGTVRFIDPAVDQTTGTVRLKGTFGNREGRLWPGQFVQVELILSRYPDALVIPGRAVQTGQNGEFVYVVRPDKSLELRTVTVGPATGGDIVVEQGVQEGETVVTDGHLRLAPGTRVEIREEPPLAAEPRP